MNGNKVSVTAKYFKSATMSNTVKNMTDVSCYESSSPSKVSFSTKADAFWEYTNTLIIVECLAVNAADCLVKYEIAGTCMAKSAAPTPVPTAVTAAPTPTTATK